MCGMCSAKPPNPASIDRRTHSFDLDMCSHPPQQPTCLPAKQPQIIDGQPCIINKKPEEQREERNASCDTDADTQMLLVYVFPIRSRSCCICICILYRI